MREWEWEWGEIKWDLREWERERGKRQREHVGAITLYIFFAKSYYYIYLHFYSLTPQFQQFLHITTVFRDVIKILIDRGLKEESIFFFFNENPK